VSLDGPSEGRAAHVFSAGYEIGQCAEGGLVRDENKGFGGMGEGDASLDGGRLLGLGQGERRVAGSRSRPGQSAETDVQHVVAGGMQSHLALLEQAVDRETVAVSADGQQTGRQLLGEIQNNLGLALAAKVGHIAAEDQQIAPGEVRGRAPQQRGLSVKVREQADGQNALGWGRLASGQGAAAQ